MEKRIEFKVYGASQNSFSGTKGKNCETEGFRSRERVKLYSKSIIQANDHQQYA